MTLFGFLKRKLTKGQTGDAHLSQEEKDALTIERIEAAAAARTEIENAVGNLQSTLIFELSLNNIRLKDHVTQKDANDLYSEIEHIIHALNQVYDATGMSLEFQSSLENDPSLGVYNQLQELVLKTQAYVDMYEPLKPVLSGKSLPPATPEIRATGNVLTPSSTTLTPTKPGPEVKQDEVKQDEVKQHASYNPKPTIDTTDSLIITISGLSSQNPLEEIIRKLTLIKGQLTNIDFDTSNLAVKSPFAQAKARFELSASLSLTLPTIMRELENKIAKSSDADRAIVHALITEINVLRKAKMQGISAHKLS